MSPARNIILIAHNLRSTHNVGALLRTADGMGVTKVFLTGYTPYPSQADDRRLPYLRAKLDKQIHKTALGAEQSVPHAHAENIEAVIASLKKDGFTIAALEQAVGSISLPDFDPPSQIALLVGREVEGIESEILSLVDTVIEIPMLGKKESLNVTQAAAIALYHIRFSKL